MATFQQGGQSLAAGPTGNMQQYRTSGTVSGNVSVGGGNFGMPVTQNVSVKHLNSNKTLFPRKGSHMLLRDTGAGSGNPDGDADGLHGGENYRFFLLCIDLAYRKPGTCM